MSTLHFRQVMTFEPIFLGQLSQLLREDRIVTTQAAAVSDVTQTYRVFTY